MISTLLVFYYIIDMANKMVFIISKMSWQRIVTILFLFFWVYYCNGQDIYKTPKGKKYHLGSCKMVENFEKKLVNEADIAAYGLEPCKICKPPSATALNRNFSRVNKSVGEATSVQCKGITKNGTRCKHRTRLSNGFCYQHKSNTP